MSNLPPITAMTLVAALVAAPVLAQQSADPSPNTDTPAAAPANPAAPTPAAATPAAPAIAGNPNLVVATVKMKNGWRASKLIGSAIYNDQNQKIGSIDDLILTRDDKVAIAVISVGGFLGIGSKLVAVPYDQLRVVPDKNNADRIELPAATKDALNAMPNFTYGNS